MSDQKIIVPIKGMHCKSCEILLEDEFSKIAGVASCKADFKKRRIELIGSPSFSQFDLDKAAKLAGYSIGETVVQPFFKITEYDIKDLSVAFLFLLAAYYIFQVLGLGNFSINATSGISMPIAVLVGLTAGFSTCMALVGGLVLGVATKHNEAHPEASAMEKFRPHLTFNFGRIVIFGILGGVLGAMGSTLKISPSVTGGLIILAGAVMLLMGLQLLEIFPRLNNFKITLPKSIARILGIEKHFAMWLYTNNANLCFELREFYGWSDDYDGFCAWYSAWSFEYWWLSVINR
ncbi:MAG: sulfite exporter TauE/SafE family protein [Candidatus Falkowbacteria bacterium]|nr:sulfite exporter TauE/SafE family protein [Candidatus Falkowbacteria bacterium]